MSLVSRSRQPPTRTHPRAATTEHLRNCLTAAHLGTAFAVSCPNMIRPCTRTHPVRVPGTWYRTRYRHVHMSWYMVLNPVPLCTQVMVHGSQAQVYLSGERSQMLPINIYVGSQAARSWAQIINSDNSQPTQLHTSSLQASRG